MYGDFMLFVARWSFNSAQEPLELCGQLAGSHHPVEWRRIRMWGDNQGILFDKNQSHWGWGMSLHFIYIYNIYIYNVYIYNIYIYNIYILYTQIWLLIKNPLSGNDHSSRIFFLSRIFRKLHVDFSRNACWATAPLMKIHHLPNHTKSSRITSSRPCKHAASITASPSQDKWLLIRQVFARLTGQLPSKCTWLVPTLSTFAEFSRKYPYPQAPAISRGRTRGKANTRALGVWLSQTLTFGSLAAAFGACFLRLQRATLGKEVLQDHGIWLTFGSLAATSTYGAVPFSCRTPGGRRW